MKRLTFVTSLYDLTKRGSTQHRTVDWMFANSDFVMRLEYPLVVFCEPEWAAEVLKRREGHPTEIICEPFESLLDPARVQGIERGQIQTNATRTKVTPSYIQLMWAKYAMLERIALREGGRGIKAHPNATHLGWIDFSITHIAKTDGIDSSIFADPSDRPRVHMLRPFTEKDVQLPDYWWSVNGHLAGGLVVGKIGHIATLCDDFWSAADRAINFGLAPLDEGLLSYVVGRDPGYYTFSYGDYCDILTNHDRPRTGLDHLRWQQAYAERHALANIQRNIRLLEENTMNKDDLTPVPEVELLRQRLMLPKESPYLLGLVMIVKNEAHGIAATLRSIKPHVDCWTILDTGSTDGTQDIIRTVMEGLHGELFEEPFVDFSTTRNRALDIHDELSTFTFMPDADDTLVNGESLRMTLRPLRNQAGPKHQAYNVRIRRDQLTYHLPLVLRSAAKWRYRYRVHEIVGPSDGSAVYPEIELPFAYTAQSRPAQSSIATAARWQRDLIHLREDFAANPKDPRLAFYLAQTYECLSRPMDALEIYRQRVAIGGWYEETYETKLRIAKILDTLERSKLGGVTWAQVEDAFHQLYAERPTHAEPLFHLARHWYDAGKHPLAFLYAERVARTPQPKDGLFVDADVYAWRAAEIASISGFYCENLRGIREAGRKFAEQCVRAQPGNERFRSNWAFYAPSATQMFAGYSDKAIGIVPEHPYVANNPSVFYDRELNTWSCLVRTTNYRIINGEYLTHDENGQLVSAYQKPINTRNYYLVLDPALDVMRQVELIDRTDIEKSAYPVHGYEDSRLFRWHNTLYCTATVCDFDLERAADGPREIVLYRFDRYSGSIHSAEPLRGPWSGIAQKNWMPIVEGDVDGAPLRLVYAAAPHGLKASVITVKPDDGDNVFSTIDVSHLEHGRLRGGSQVIKIPDGYLCIVHDVVWPGEGARIYLHRFVRFDENLTIVAMSDPFHFRKLGIEFCAGLAWDGHDRLVASFGLEDREPWFGIFSLKTVLAALRTDFVI